MVDKNALLRKLVGEELEMIQDTPRSGVEDFLWAEDIPEAELPDSEWDELVEFLTLEARNALSKIYNDWMETN